MALRRFCFRIGLLTQREAFRALNRSNRTRIGGDTALGVKDPVFQLSKDIQTDVQCCKDESANIRPYSSTGYYYASLDARMAVIGLKLA
jgi:hypothetical protein